LYTVLSCRVIFGYINIDAYIANHNIAAIEDLPADYEENREIYGPFKKSLILDENYIYRLSNDALEQKISLRTPTSDDNKKNHIYELITNEILDAPRYNRNRSVSKAYIYKESQKNLYGLYTNHLKSHLI